MTPLTPYRIDIQQGNAITQEMVAKLKPGMTRAQVRFALGTPLIVDTFRTDRWDYVYYYEKPSAPREYRHVVVVFKGDRLERLEGDVVPLREGKGTLSIDKAPAASGAASTSAAIGGAKGAPAAEKSPSGGSEPPAQETEKKKPADPAPAKDRGYSEPIVDSLGF